MRSLLLVLSLMACKGNTDTPTEADADADTDTDTDADTDTDTDIAPPHGDPATVELLGLCPAAERWGGIRVDNGEQFAFVDGSVRNGVVPATVPEPVNIIGDCSLDRRLNPFCDPPCGPSQTCDTDETCIPFPETQDLGTIEVAGTLPESVAIEPFAQGFSYSDTTVANPPVSPDALIELRAPDSPWGPLSLHAVGVEPITLQAEPLVINDDDLVITWTPPASAAARSTVLFLVNIDQHGNSPVLLTCEFADTGVGTVPVVLLDELINSGVSGFPSGTATRQTADRQEVGTGCMDLQVTSSRLISVEVEGFTPCNGPGQCPAGEVCDTLIEQCVPE